MSVQQSYESNMRVIGYLYNTLKDNYGTIQLEDFNRISLGITSLLDVSQTILASFTQTMTPIMGLRNESIIRQNARRNAHLIQSPPPTQQTINHSPIVLNYSDEEEYDDDDDEYEEFYSEEEIMEYYSSKVKPKLTTKFFSKKEYQGKTSECVICFKEYEVHDRLTFGCGHEFCKDCVCHHFHHSVKNQPDNLFYSCPICRADVKQVRVNYTKMNAKNKKELMDGALVNQMMYFCKLIIVYLLRFPIRNVMCLHKGLPFLLKHYIIRL